MVDALEKDGDEYEKKYWPLLRSGFPNYEVFWGKFIVRLRATDGGIALEKGLHPALETTAMAHYSVFYHLVMAAELKEGSGQERAEDILFHLSSATEMVERLIFALAQMEIVVKGGELASQLPEATIPARALAYISSQHYSNDYARFLKRGQSANLTLHHIEDVTEPFMQNISSQASSDHGDWQKTAQQIRHYRNVLTHNPRLGMLANEQGRFFVPGEPELNKYELWSAVTDRSNNDDFMPLSELLSNFQASLLQKTDVLWRHLIGAMEVLTKTEGYIRLTGGGVAATHGAQRGSAAPTVAAAYGETSGSAVAGLTPPSGTHSHDPDEPSGS